MLEIIRSNWILETAGHIIVLSKILESANALCMYHGWTVSIVDWLKLCS